MSSDFAAGRERMLRAAQGLPEIAESVSYGSSPTIKVRGKFLSRVKDADTLVMCPLEEKEMLMAAVPGIYFETAHYKGWPAMLIRLSAIDDEELAHRMRRAFLMQAPKTLAKAFVPDQQFPPS